MTRAFEWQFGGWLRALPPVAAWSLMGLLAVAGLLLVVWLYRRTLRELPPAARGGLTIFRAAIVLVVLLCLANPVRVERGKPEKSKNDTLAVVVDRSASMGMPDYRGVTRLADAVRTWKQHEDEARAAFSNITYQRFALAASPAQSLDEAVNAGASGNGTHLYSALRETLATSPAAVVCLTDGLDTTSDKIDDFADEARRHGVPLYFVTGKNRARASEMLNIREIKAPPSVLRQTQFTASALIEVAAPRNGELPVELWSGGAKLSEARLPLRAGLNTLAWPVTVTAAEPGAMPLEFRVGDGARQQIAACTTHVVERVKVDVLYYQGALQWGYRFLVAALQSDPSFRMTGILNPALRVQLTVASPGQATLVDLPDDARELKRFQIVVLAHVFADQLSPRQQQALVDYAKNGGSVLFIAPDSNAAARFSGTPLEQMLPIVFEPPKQESRSDSAERQFQEHMQAIGGSQFPDETQFANQAIHRQEFSELLPFAAPAGKAGSKLFQTGSNAPQFSEYAQVRSVKAGADILAVHPGDRVPDGNAPRVLVARQQFGEGFAAALTTDLLWRWKMSLPSTSHAVEIFWQQFLLSLAPVSGHGLRLVKLTESPVIGAPVALRIDGSGAESAPVVEAVSSTGGRRRLDLQNDGSRDAAWSASVTPDAEGRWEVRATDPAGNLTRVIFSVAKKMLTIETANLPPDVEGMRRLAESTGGALIGEGPVFQKHTQEDDGLKILRVHPMWNSTWLLTLLLGLYAAELVTRRLLRLL